MSSVVGEAVSQDAVVYDPGRRFPIIMSAAGYDAVPDLSEKEKQLGIELLRLNYADLPGVDQPAEHAAVQRRNPYLMLQSDPELLDAFTEDGQALYQAVVGKSIEEVMETSAAGHDGQLRDADQDHQRRWQTALLIVAKVMHEYQDEWGRRLVATGPSWNFLSREQLSLLGRPQSVVWDDDQRLVLEYVEAVIHRSLSDDLFDRAEAAWGRKQRMRYTAQLTDYVAVVHMMRVNITDAERTGRLP